ncbi:MAG: adenylate/guanylate cyclase domain-containing protein [Balneolaceae bacterium]|nr:adenylate/guanylate cyclase domain-containing protein [Balneolaceae bacterium]MBO6546727.1 adenylate/guanylate cyclase domain-containing protein [Balneolaceae bacterium]MBO6649085.1 adenylate/guanylate cyclase domain-containing protein [Balneolaceae bacterium]
MKAQQRINRQKVIVIIGIWTLIGGFLSLYDHWAFISHLSEGGSEDYSFLSNLAFNMFAGLIGGAMGGVFLVYYFNRKFRSTPYLKSIIAVSLAFVTIVTIITFLMSTLQAGIENGFNFSDPITIERMKELVLTTQHLKNILFWAFIVALTQFTLLVNDKFGQGLLWSIVRGKYTFPQTEERIFMFLDLKSSTSIAEQLGNLDYHKLLKDIFSDITDPILNHKGEIYQYVGDEVVISWKFLDGVEKSNCIECYFDIRRQLYSLRGKYEQDYGLMPEFKAGIHYGNVVAGEIGIIKRDITYSGDVLNTTARIQGMCNEFGVNLLSSKKLLDKLTVHNGFAIKTMGAIPLRGKELSEELIAVEQAV